MKKTILGFSLFTILLFPSLSHAQFVPFGGLDDAVLPYCDCFPIPEELACGQPFEPPAYIFHIFAPLWIGTAAPMGAILGVPIEEFSLTYPLGTLAPEWWALGELIPVTPDPATSCGIYINFSEDCPESVIGGLCIPVFPAIGIVTPFTGSAPVGL